PCVPQRCTRSIPSPVPTFRPEDWPAGHVSSPTFRPACTLSLRPPAVHPEHPIRRSNVPAGVLAGRARLVPNVPAGLHPVPASPSGAPGASHPPLQRAGRSAGRPGTSRLQRSGRPAPCPCVPQRCTRSIPSPVPTFRPECWPAGHVSSPMFRPACTLSLRPPAVHPEHPIPRSNVPAGVHPHPIPRSNVPAGVHPVPASPSGAP
ncbi:uncharacterized protein B0H18DRAFT_832894, partial [Fomitopsis serialis]|uniref:uncharacterized protein n=1 Tax=Fomitopsis serialis TaxID=139415 RepID=UPI0020075121